MTDADDNLVKMAVAISMDWLTEIITYYVEKEGMSDIIDILIDIDEPTFTTYLVEHHEMIKSEDVGQACEDAGFIHPENYEPDRDENG